MGRRKLTGTPITNEEAINRSNVFNSTKVIIQLISFLLVSFYGFLTLRDIPFYKLFNDSFVDTLLKITLALYYGSWLLGINLDMKNEEKYFLFAPNQGRLDRMTIIVMVILGVLFFVLCYFVFYKDYKFFSVFLLLFFIGDKIGNIFINRFFEKTIIESKNKYRELKNIKGLYSIASIEEFLSGEYLRKRFVTGIIIISVLLLVSFTDIPERISFLKENQIVELFKASIVLIYVIVIETWIWIKRIKRIAILNVLDKMDEKDFIILTQANEK